MKKIKIVVIALVVLIPVGLVGIGIFSLVGPMSKAVTAQEMIGKYEAQLPDGGKEIIELMPEGICRQSIFLKNDQKLQVVGKWKYRHGALAGNQLVLTDIRYSLSEFGDKINPEIQQVEKNTATLLPIKRALMGQIKIELDSDQGIYYRKIAN